MNDDHNIFDLLQIPLYLNIRIFSYLLIKYKNNLNLFYKKLTKNLILFYIK